MATKTVKNKQEASSRAATGYPFSVERRKDKYSRSVTYAVHGFWSGDNVRVSQSRDYRDGKWEAPQINWSCGGREYNVEPSDSVAVECFGKAMIRAAQVARRWQKDNV